MATQEIKDTDWETFCERFSEELRGALLTVDVVYHDGHTEMLARQSPLAEFRFQKTNGCNDVIHMALGEGAGRTVQHQIVEPIHFRLTQAAGEKNLLRIDAEAGSVEIRFSAGRNPLSGRTSNGE